MIRFLRAIVVALVLALSVCSAPPAEAQTTDADVYVGLAFFEQYDRAEPLLEEVFKTNPDLDSLGYDVGFLRYRKKD